MPSILLETEVLRLTRLRSRVRAFTDLADGSIKGKWAMVTLTYAPGIEWEPRQIVDYCKKVRHWLKRRGHRFVYCWVAELQQRGAPHYHLLVKLPNKRTKLPKPDASGMWPHGMSEVDWVYKSARNYMAKYCSKITQRYGCKFAKGMRLHGAGGLLPPERAWWRWLLAPYYVRVETEPKDLVKRCPGGYKVTLGPGYRFIPTPWTAVCYPGRGVIITPKSADEWAKSAIDYQPHITEMNRHDAWKRVCNYADVMLRHAGTIIKNPFHNDPN